MSDSLTERQQEAVELLPATTPTLREQLGYGSNSPVYDMVSRIDGATGYEVAQNENGEYYLASRPGEGPHNAVETNRTPTTTKQAITRKATKTLTELEETLVRRLNEFEPARSDYEPEPGNEDMVLPRSDDHFGQVGTDDRGREIFNSEIAADRVNQYIDRALEVKEQREAMGTTFDSVKLLMLGDHATNEAIYDGQPHEIDSTILGQLGQVAETYISVINRLAAAFPSVDVITQHGNHGEFRTGGQSSDANADDILYLLLDLAIRQSDHDNVTFVQNDATNYTEFDLRGGRHHGHIRHGDEHGLGHIGTSSAQNRWNTWLQDSRDRGLARGTHNGFDVAYWGHFHEVKIEPIAGRPVIMAGTTQPAGDFEDSLGIPTGEPAGIIHGATDSDVLAWSEFVSYDNT